MKLLELALIVIALLLPGCWTQSATNKTTPSQAKPSALPTVAPMKSTGKLTPPDNPEEFTFVVFGDNRPGKGEPQPETIKEIFSEIKEIDPAFAMSLGDIIEGKPSPNDRQAIEEIRKQFTEFLALAEQAGVPIFNAPGNHEMDDSQDVPTQRMHDLYHECVGPSYGAFNYGNSRFIVLNTEDIPAADTPKPPEGEEFSFMSPKQIAELKADLDINRDKKYIFITMHYPIHAKDEGPPESEWDDRLTPKSRKALLELFDNYDNIAYVLAAHEHLYYNPQLPENVGDVPEWKPGDPINYLISGGAGAPLNKGKWGFHHYLIFKVTGARVTVELVRLQSTGASS